MMASYLKSHEIFMSDLNKIVKNNQVKYMQIDTESWEESENLTLCNLTLCKFNWLKLDVFVTVLFFFPSKLYYLLYTLVILKLNILSSAERQVFLNFWSAPDKRLQKDFLHLLINLPRGKYFVFYQNNSLCFMLSLIRKQNHLNIKKAFGFTAM